MQVLPSASRPDLAAFMTSTIQPGSTAVTDGFRSYPGASIDAGVLHEPHIVFGSGHQAHETLLGVHLVFSLVRRVLEGTFRGGVQSSHLQAYLDEFVFRFNRRTATQRGLLFLRLLEHAVVTEPATYNSLVIDSRPRPGSRPIIGIRALPNSLTQQLLQRPRRSIAA